MQSGEVMNFIDFQQLQIDNELSVKKIDEINKELLSLKKSYAKIVEQVNSTKKRIGDLLNEENMLKQEMEGRKKVLAKTEKDIRKVAVEREKARKENSKLRGMTRNVRTDGGGSGGPRVGTD
ncbi:hypothetical protein Pmar_PMAR010489 [Perkinsus marinus ATCC 50983]|uniref:Cilia- and flagella-associated protein 263 n=1 Tax=Perkinsus marinus (strain ATCC 50983 / TXsc) TaxID=423536 RepID=C5KQ37_PERM5|nr:hypothetical protein Pmar_PMAR010489 [Perkinsus marinus ATCC 50983]EER13392.1 hypothetical protein Pmar_PMAR010489 [Perkinsus marinus ATCC 50983]|eukprot:XP_002781597.1 hypothetical protein Pmar_PMAR010489 [Perkinsus marinus ATCC 50983]